jgi:hypothetical protein
MKRQMEFDDEYTQHCRAMLAKEEPILAERRAQARQTAEAFRQERAEKAAEKAAERDADRREGRILAEQMQYELDLEKQTELDARQRAAAFNREVRARHGKMIQYRESLLEIEETEE